jgi:hypothetical protein
VSTATKQLDALDWPAPEIGHAADCYNVAATAVILRGNAPKGFRWLEPARHAVLLHQISGKLHRLAERQCNEDLTCRQCGGAGQYEDQRTGDAYGQTCRACAGKGVSTGKRETRLERAATEIARYYGLACYFQGDPRGCSLYIGKAEDMNGANYNQGHAVVRLG